MGSESAAYFADHNQSQLERQKSNSAPTTPTFNGSSNGNNIYGDDDMGPSVSMAVQADDDESFQKTTFNLKRTRSMGYFDDYIDPTKKLLGKSTSKEDGVSKERDDFEVSENSDDYDDDDDYNTDSDSGSGSYSDNDDNDNFENEQEEADHNGYESRPHGLSPSVSPPPADADTLLLPQDDNDLMREPERHVDYLSHNWNEWDISKSWKYIILKKKKRTEDLVNAARLENASWRTWAKARNHLKTVLPEIVNWSKDSDVTWLYGPIVRDRDEDDASDVERGYGSDDENSKRIAAPTKVVMKKTPNSPTPKPILKKRTVSEILAENSEWKLNEVKKLINEMKHASVVMDPYGGVKTPKDAYDDYDALAAKVNAQYYRSNQAHGSQTIETNSSKKVSDLISRKFGSNNRYSNGQQAQSRHAAQEESKSAQDGQPSSEHIESPFTFLKSNFKTEKSNKTRHIHFNDRVEQCMALATPASDSEYSDDENGTFFPRSIRKETSSKNQDGLQSAESSGSSSSGDESDEDDDNAGLFINPTISRRTESNSHYTDSSSQNSSVHSRVPLNPIIKLLPATTLNYGSDEEDPDNEEYNGYGNAVSHNVNTYRGYDYMYDYNSVYTGDTSNFLPVDGCDVVDVPDGIDLHAAMAADSASTYEMGHAVSPSNREPGRHSKQLGTNSLFYDSSQSSDSDSEEQFIEDSQYRSSDDDDDSLSLRRTVSFGKNGKTNSLRDLTKPASSSSFQPVKTRSFITGKALNAIDKNQEKSTAQEHTANGKKPIRPRCLKHNSSSSSFIFNSDSDEDSEDDEDGSDSAIQVEERSSIKSDKTDENVVDCQKSFFSSFKQSKPVPPQSTVVSSDPMTFTSSIPSQVSDMSKSLRLKNSSSLAEVGASDVAISGSFSPRSDSVKSVVSNQGIVNKTSNELREMNEHLEAYHLDDQNETTDDDANESIQKMMLNARELAQKYLHSWKKPDSKQDDSRAGSIGT
ncbi:hypothetical protein HG537_0D04170 [Torulaspora globosa]|uniref:Nitrogen regulatory protein areA GATA-like domain-containing protein n=1 Tax=Torulaspora globosa TaxID=48254 RepID=A0A7H9HTK7_9SACH|nr:hypothetical protein HG537_0D04170 [Torulaspora sp. CBS 2947]